MVNVTFFFHAYILGGGKIAGESTYAVSLGTRGTSGMMCMTRAEMVHYLLDELTSFGDLLDPVPATDGN